MNDVYRAPNSDSGGDDDRAVERGRGLLLLLLTLPLVNVPVELFIAPRWNAAYYALALFALSYLVYQGRTWAKRLMQAWCALMVVAHLVGITPLAAAMMARELALAVAHAVTLVVLWRSRRVGRFLRYQREGRLARRSPVAPDADDDAGNEA